MYHLKYKKSTWKLTEINGKVIIDDEIKARIVEGKSSMEIRDEALRQGYKPLVIDGINKVVKGLTTLEELNKKLLIF